MEGELRRRESEVANLERRLKQAKDNLRTTEQEHEMREQAMTALVRSLEERLARKEGKDAKKDSDSAGGRGSPDGQEWQALLEQLREAARQLSRGSACSDDDVKAILHKVLKDAAANKHKVVELKGDVARHKEVIETLENSKANAHRRAAQLEKEVEAHEAQLLMLKLELARRDREAEQGEEDAEHSRTPRQTAAKDGRSRESRDLAAREGSDSPERRELESRIEELTRALQERDHDMEEALRRVDEETARADQAGERILKRMTSQTEEQLRTIAAQAHEIARLEAALEGCLAGGGGGSAGGRLGGGGGREGELAEALRGLEQVASALDEMVDFQLRRVALDSERTRMHAAQMAEQLRCAKEPYPILTQKGPIYFINKPCIFPK